MTSSAVVTGAAKGIGAAVSVALLQAGYAVVGIDADTERLDEFESAHPGFTSVGGDVRDEAVLDAAVMAAQRVGMLSGWVNNAGIVFVDQLHAAPRDKIDRTISINLGGVIYGARKALEAFMVARTPGAIVNISSIHGQAAFPGWSVYDAAKGGIDALTRSICAEYGHLGIRCNAVAPGAVNTEILAKQVREAPDGPESVWAEVRALSPMRRVVEPEEVAAAVTWLLSSAASSVNGQVLAVDGGALSRSMSFPEDPNLRF